MPEKYPTKFFEGREAADQWARKLSLDFGCIYSVLNDGHRYSVAPGGSNDLATVRTFWKGADVTRQIGD